MWNHERSIKVGIQVAELRPTCYVTLGKSCNFLEPQCPQPKEWKWDSCPAGPSGVLQVWGEVIYGEALKRGRVSAGLLDAQAPVSLEGETASV